MPQHEPVICPNCGSAAEKNYCSQCGQATHLHDETFTALVVHFFAHYFHYESKFWQTVKTLCTKPGALAVAYRNKQRMRFVPPMSLYIFTVVGYFILSTLVLDIYSLAGIHDDTAATKIETTEAAEGIRRVNNKVLNEKAKNKLIHVLEHSDEYDPKVTKMAPKLFFIMVPVLAFFISLFFLGHKDYSFLDHAVFSFHLYTLLFFVLFIADLFVFTGFYDAIFQVGVFALVLYCIKAMTVAYNIGYIKAVLYSGISIALNLVVFCILLLLMLVLI